MQRRADGTSLSEIAIRYQVSVGDDIRPAGQDVRKGECVLQAGTMLRPSEIGVLASLGYDSVSVFRRPVVAILATGNELLEPGRPLSARHDIQQQHIQHRSQRTALRRRTQAHWHRPRQPRLHERQPARRTRFRHAGNIRGRLQGDYDMVKDVLSQHGEIDFWSVRMRPPSPSHSASSMRAKAEKCRFSDCPGNPVSALVAFEQFGRAAIRRMLGKPDAPKPTITAILDEPIYNTDSRRVFAPRYNTPRKRHLSSIPHPAARAQPAHIHGARERSGNLSRRPPRQASRRNRPGADARLDRGNLLTPPFALGKSKRPQKHPVTFPLA